MCELVHLSIGTRSGPDHMKLIVQFCICTGEHVGCHTLDFLSYPCTKGSIGIDGYSENITLHIPPQ